MQVVQVNIKQIVTFSDSSGAQTSYLTEAWEFLSKSFFLCNLVDRSLQYTYANVLRVQLTYETKQKPGVKGDKYFISCTFKREYMTRNSFLRQRLLFGTEKEKKRKKNKTNF